MQLTFAVAGNPVPKARPRVYGRRTITEPRTLQYEALVRRSAALAKRNVAWPLDGRYQVVIVVHRESEVRCDLDNVAKAILDAANGVLWNDDHQVDDLRALRGRVDRECPRAEIYVRVLDEFALEYELTDLRRDQNGRRAGGP